MAFSTDLHMRLLLSLDRGHNVRRAVTNVVRPGDRVLDAGTGTGLLSFVALAAGASEAVAVDRQHIDLARALAERNKLADRMTFIEADLADLELPGVDMSRPFDVLLAFIYTNHPLVDEARSRMVFELRDRYGREGCTVLPGGIRYRVTGCERNDWDLHTETSDLQQAADILHSVYDLDFQPLVDQTMRELAIKRSRPIDPTSRDWRPPTRMAAVRFPRPDVRLLTDADVFTEIDYSTASYGGFPPEIALRVVNPGRLSGVLWTQELLHAGNPLWTTETFSPLREPLLVSAGDRVVVCTDDEWRVSNTLRVREHTTVTPATS